MTTTYPVLSQGPQRSNSSREPAGPFVQYPAGVKRERVLRRDIQGLRAIAVTLVVLYHAHVPGIRAGYVGVDVFFVISGFLITGQILREVDRTGRISLASFYARRMRRLLPAAMLVVVSTVVVARLWGPVLQLRSTAIDALWTAAYSINFRLAAEGVNYQQATGPVSPLQHFWSLAVEEQFYLVWPLLIVVCVLAARWVRTRTTLGLVAVAGVALSLYICVRMTAESAPTAYFSAQTRAWEFALGALVAIGSAQLARVPAVPRAGATWVGLAMILAAAVVYDDATPFPGTAALVPVAGCALVIAGGCGATGRGSANSVLDRRPVQLVGRFSYSWYLWHWPMLVLAPAVLATDLSWIRNLELSVLALWLAGLTYAVVEHPTQRSRRSRRVWVLLGFELSGGAAAAAAVVLLLAPSIAGSGGYAAPLDLRYARTGVLAQALVRASADPNVPANLTPSLSRAAGDVPVTESGCHLNFLQVKQAPCVFGDPAGTKTVILFGDSHAQQWDGALNSQASHLHWRLVSWTKAACPVADVRIVQPTLKREYSECDTWRQQTISRINATHPALVIVSQSDTVPGLAMSNTVWADQTLATVSQLEHAGTQVLFVADTPYPKTDIPTCVAANLADVRTCQTPRQGAYGTADLYLARHQMVTATLQSAGIAVADPVDWLCSPTSCPAIVGNTLVYRDNSHMTNTYSTQLGPLLGPWFDPTLPGLRTTGSP